jgi:hypothetical protein
MRRIEWKCSTGWGEGEGRGEREGRGATGDDCGILDVGCRMSGYNLGREIMMMMMMKNMKAMIKMMKPHQSSSILSSLTPNHCLLQEASKRPTASQPATCIEEAHRQTHFRNRSSRTRFFSADAIRTYIHTHIHTS